MQFLKPILKHVTSKFIVQKQQLYEQIEMFLKMNYIAN